MGSELVSGLFDVLVVAVAVGVPAAVAIMVLHTKGMLPSRTPPNSVRKENVETDVLVQEKRNQLDKLQHESEVQRLRHELEFEEATIMAKRKTLTLERDAEQERLALTAGDDSSTAAQLIQSRRYELGKTVQEVARAAGISPQRLGEIERGTKSPTIEDLKALTVPLRLEYDPGRMVQRDADKREEARR